ncbi:core-2/I-branching enzyme-domain-containing protein [Ochromonadaceae sp. CCMP2298]|nr:core-2/I-branching enzyme-domain-containing protein [Ochromonadaceae sp. CCMP2298]
MMEARHQQGKLVLWCLFLLALIPRALGEGGEGKVAFLFLSRGAMALEDIWYAFFNFKADPALYSIYIHTSTEHHFPADSLFFNRSIASQQVRWGGFSQVVAMKALVRAALQDPMNENFCLMSESCIPLVSFSTWHSAMLGSKSVVNACPMPMQEMEGDTRWRPGLDAVGFQKQHWRKSANWFALTSAHATIFTEEVESVPGWQEIPNSDEHYLPSILAARGLDNETTCSDGFAYVYWASSSGNHPTTFGASSVTPAFIASLQQPVALKDRHTQSLFSHTCSGLDVCHFTARKFADSAILPLLDVLPILLGDSIPNPWIRHSRVLRRGQDGTHYLVEGNDRLRQLPDPETLQYVLQMYRSKGAPVSAIAPLSASDSLYRVGLDLPSRRDGLLYQAGRSHEVFYMQGGHRRSIPNIDVFVAMHLDIGQIIHIPHGDLEAIPMGEALPIPLTPTIATPTARTVKVRPGPRSIRGAVRERGVMGRAPL